MARILFILQSAFSLWMLVDALRRGCRSYWYLVILMPFGEIVYFFMVKIHDPEFEWLRNFYRQFTTPEVTVDDLRFKLEETPSFVNTLQLAQALHDNASYSEAADLFAAALELHDDSRDALYGLALSQLELKDYELAVANLEKVIEMDPTFKEYAPWSDLAWALTANRQPAEALDTLDRLVVKSPRLKHRMLYAHYLIGDERVAAAREQLELGLRENDAAPKFVRRNNRAWARKAKKMLREIPASA